MKAKANYNPVTQSAGGEYEVTKTDYSEGRKNTLMSVGIVLLVIVGIGLAIWYLLKNVVSSAIPDPIKAITETVANTQAKATDAIVSGANTNRFSTTPLTTADYDNMLKGAGLAEIPVRIGNMITPPSILEAAAKAGSDAANTVNKNGLTVAYNELPGIEKGLVTLGEGVGKLAGVDLIQMGWDFGSMIKSSNILGQPAGSHDPALSGGN